VHKDEVDTLYDSGPGFPSFPVYRETGEETDTDHQTVLYCGFNRTTTFVNHKVLLPNCPD
jgi:hypothetical protein